MHNPSPLYRSKSYNYKLYPYRRPPCDLKHDVVIIGAGPIGLLTALELANHGIKTVIVTAEQQVCHGSRAIVLTRRSLDILHQAGAIDRFLEKGLPWQYGNSYYRGEKVYRMVIPHSEDERFLPCLNLQQPYIEEFLIESCLKTGLVDIYFGCKAGEIEGETLSIDTSEGDFKLTSRYFIAADGGRSALRKMSGQRMEGRAYAGNFVIVDIRCDLPLPTERLCYFDPEWNPQNNVLLHRQPDGLWRLDYRLADNDTAENALKPVRLNASIKAILAMVGYDLPYEIDWATVYSASTLTLPDYKHGNTFFVGDAAHLLPIFGVRGANTGFMDANNLAWKLAFVLKGDAPEKLLESYSQERVPAAREIIEESGKSTRFMTPPTEGFRVMRDAVLELSLTQDFVKDLLHWRTSKPQAYPNSPLVTNNGGLVANVKLDDGWLLDIFTDIKEFSLIVYGEPVDFPLPQIVMEGEGKITLVRPDLHIAAEFDAFDFEAIDKAYRKALGYDQ